MFHKVAAYVVAAAVLIAGSGVAQAEQRSVPNEAVAQTPVVTAAGMTAPPPLVGTDVGQLAARVTVHDPAGALGTPYGSLENIAPTGPRSTSSIPPPWYRRVVFTLESGTPTDGVWVARTPVTAADGGTWALTDLTYSGPGPTFDDANKQSVVVSGSDWPVIDVRRPPGVPGAYGSRVVLKGSVHTSRTHRPVAGMRMAIWL